MERDTQLQETVPLEEKGNLSPVLTGAEHFSREQDSEAARLSALKQSGLLDSPPGPEFDRITKLATRLTHAPFAVFTLLNEHREILKSGAGLTEPLTSNPEWPLSPSFCKHVVTSGEPLSINDARKDPLLRDNPAIRDLGIVAYLGVPVHAPGGIVIASFCVMDNRPRTWSSDDLTVMQDLAKLISTEIALRWNLEESHRNAQRFERFVNISPAIIYILDVHERRGLFVSSATETLIGKPPKEILESGSSFLPENMHPDDYARWSNYYITRLRHLADGDTATFECRIRDSDGSWRWFLTHEVVFSRDSTGAVQQILGSAIDTTARKNAERALTESEKRLDIAISGAELGTWDWNLQTGHVAYSDRTAKMLNYSLDDLEQNVGTWEKLVHAEDKARVQNELKKHLEGHTPLFCVEQRLRAKDGTWKWILTAGKVLERNDTAEPLRAAGIYLDITAQKTAEAAANDADRKLARILESMKEACASVDGEWRYTFINPQWETFFGWERSKVIGRIFWEVAPEVCGTMIEEYSRKVMTERVSVRFEVFAPIVQRWLEMRIFPAADGGLSIFVLDVHERKLAEEALREKDQRKDEFIAMLGHELRNPLAALQHAVAMCNADTNPATFHWAKGVVERQSTHLAHLVNQLLDVSRITEGKIRIQKQRVDIATVLDQSLDEIRPSIVERRHEVTASYLHDFLWVDGDPDRLEQVFSNLLTNATKYTDPGGHIWIDAQVAQSGASTTNQEIVVTIRDNGTGIIPEKLAQMFDVFVQGERTLARSEGGLGLGLTIVKAVIEMHGGRVAAQSEGLGKGSTFTVHLPAAAPPLMTPPPYTPAEPQKPVPHRVLVVDDFIDTAEALARLLRRQGHIVEIATDGPQACEQAHNFSPDVVILDIGMPGMDGYEVARQLRHDQCCANSLIVALTGYGQEEDRRRAMDAGFNEHLVKPVDLNFLNRLVGDAPCRIK